MARSFSGSQNAGNAQGQGKGKDEAQKGIWSTMLDSVATGKKLPEKNLIVFGWS